MLLLFDLDDTLYSRTEQLPDVPTAEDLQKIRPFPGVAELLLKEGITKVLVTRGAVQNQFLKLKVLKIEAYFQKIMVCPTDEEKKKCFADALLQFPDTDVWVIGNRIDSEIRYGKELGLKTVLLNHGKYKALVPRDGFEIPDHTIERFHDLFLVLGVEK